MNKVCFMLKNGQSFDVICENCKVRTIEGKIMGYDITGITKNRPLYFDIDEIVAVIDKGEIKNEN